MPLVTSMSMILPNTVSVAVTVLAALFCNWIIASCLSTLAFSFYIVLLHPVWFRSTRSMAMVAVLMSTAEDYDVLLRFSVIVVSLLLSWKKRCFDVLLIKTASIHVCHWKSSPPASMNQPASSYSVKCFLVRVF